MSLKLQMDFIQTCSQAIEQIRIDLKDQNRMICDKIEALELGLQECKVNLHTTGQKHLSNRLNQRCVTFGNKHACMHKSSSSLFSHTDDILDEFQHKIDEASTCILSNNDYVAKPQLKPTN